MRWFVLCAAVAVGCGKGGSEPAGSDTLPEAEKVDDRNAIETDFNLLFSEYGDNPVAADKKFKGKVAKIPGKGKVFRTDDGRNAMGFVQPIFVGMSPGEIARLSPQQRKWFDDGEMPPNVLCYLSAAGERVAADVGRDTLVIVRGVVLGRKKAAADRGYVVEMDRCTLEIKTPDK